MKRRKYLTIALLLILGGVLACIFFHDRDEPTNDAAIDSPIEPKLKRPVRKNAARSVSAKKLAAQIDDAKSKTRKPYGCLMENNFDERSRILRQKVDFDCDGNADQCLVKTLNDYGEPVRIENHKKCGPEPDICTEIEYNEFGEEMAYFFDNDCDGNVDMCLTFKRNDHGDEVEDFMDKNCDGTRDEDDWHLCFSYEYDEDGLIVTQYDSDCGEEPKDCLDYEYDFAAGTQRQKLDINCDGTVDICKVLVFREGHNDPEIFVEKDCGGTWEYCTLHGEVDWVVSSIRDPKFCAQKYDEFLNANRAR
ncbi:MAG TPA: hypothetical protein PKW95_14095 [bacterium]|nr:hypothetical protein [bacterium]